jgi:hypothetical protein
MLPAPQLVLAITISILLAVGNVLLRTPSEWHEGKAAEAALIGTP